MWPWPVALPIRQQGSPRPLRTCPRALRAVTGPTRLQRHPLACPGPAVHRGTAEAQSSPLPGDTQRPNPRCRGSGATAGLRTRRWVDGRPHGGPCPGQLPPPGGRALTGVCWLRRGTCSSRPAPTARRTGSWPPWYVSLTSPPATRPWGSGLGLPPGGCHTSKRTPATPPQCGRRGSRARQAAVGE